MTNDELIKAMARAMFKDDQMCRLEIAKAALAVARPIIERETRERCAQICEKRYMGDNTREDMEAKRCAAAIRETGDE